MTARWRHILYIMILAISACRTGMNQHSLSANEVITVKSGPFFAGIEETGILQATKSMGIVSLSHGKIARMAPEGSAIKSGEPVVWLETKDIQERLQNEKIKVRKNETHLTQKLESLRESEFKSKRILKEKTAQREFEQVRLTRAVREYQQVLERFEKKLIPESDVLAAEDAVASRRLSLLKAEISLEQAQEEDRSNREMMQTEVSIAQKEFDRSTYSLKSLETALENCILRSPMDGIVVYSTKWNMQKFKVGDQVWREVQICKIPDLSQMKVISQAPESSYNEIPLNMEAIISVNALGNLEIPGHIQWISQLAVPRKESPGAGYLPDETFIPGKVFEIHIALDRSGDELKDGMNVTVKLIRERLDNVISIPVSALERKDNKTYVYVKKGNTVHRQRVETGQENMGRIVVKKGLEEDDIIVAVALSQMGVS